MSTFADVVITTSPIVDPEFHALIPALHADERYLLEESLKRDGCRELLVVWEETGILLTAQGIPNQMYAIPPGGSTASARISFLASVPNSARVLIGRTDLESNAYMRSLIGNLEHPLISEAGRRFLADRLMMLNDQQIHDLFTAARVERRGDTTRDQNGNSRPVTTEDWVRAFKAKRSQIVSHTCSS